MIIERGWLWGRSLRRKVGVACNVRRLAMATLSSSSIGDPSSPRPVVTCESTLLLARAPVSLPLSLTADFGEAHLLTSVVLKKLQTRLKSLQLSSLSSLPKLANRTLCRASSRRTKQPLATTSYRQHTCRLLYNVLVPMYCGICACTENLSLAIFLVITLSFSV